MSTEAEDFERSFRLAERDIELDRLRSVNGKLLEALREQAQKWFEFAAGLTSGSDYTQGQKHATKDCANDLLATVAAIKAAEEQS